MSYDRHTGRPRGFGFVVFDDPAVADKVVSLQHTIDRREVGKPYHTTQQKQMSASFGHRRSSGSSVWANMCPNICLKDARAGLMAIGGLLGASRAEKMLGCKPLSFKLLAPGRGEEGCTEGRTAIRKELGQRQSAAHEENLCGRPGTERGRERAERVLRALWRGKAALQAHRDLSGNFQAFRSSSGTMIPSTSETPPFMPSYFRLHIAHSSCCPGRGCGCHVRSR